MDKKRFIQAWLIVHAKKDSPVEAYYTKFNTYVKTLARALPDEERIIVLKKAGLLNERVQEVIE